MTPVTKNSETLIQPWLTVSSTKKAVAFYKAAFNAVEMYRIEDDDGKAVVKLSINGAIFWVSDTADNSTGDENVGGSTVRIILVADDPDTIFAEALKAGAGEIFPVGEGHGWRLGRLVDPFGLHWEIGKEVNE